MLDRVRIRTLRDAGHTLEEIAATVGVAKRSVQNILKESPIRSPESAPTPASRGIGRPSDVEAFRDQVERILQEESALPTVEILSRLRGLGYTGGKSAVYQLVKASRPPKTESPEVRFEGVPGEFSQHDFGSVKVSYADGSSQRVHFFASRLKYSRWTHGKGVPRPQGPIRPRTAPATHRSTRAGRCGRNLTARLSSLVHRTCPRRENSPASF